MSTVDGDGRRADPVRGPQPPAPAPLGRMPLGDVPGVLGSIARERAADYAGARLPERLDAVAARPGLARALGGEGIAVIAEVKRSSPSQGAIRDVDPVILAQLYQGAGAAAVSVLTESRHFGGSLAHLQAVAEAVPLPLLRKDFVVHPLQILEARAAGASAVLLIAAILGTALASYLAYASGVGLESLVEVHDESELALALDAGTVLVGVNNRDLRSLEIDRSVAPRVLRAARAAGFDGIAVAESGYQTREQVAELRGLADAVLVGTSLAGSSDPAAALAQLVDVR